MSEFQGDSRARDDIVAGAAGRTVGWGLVAAVAGAVLLIVMTLYAVAPEGKEEVAAENAATANETEASAPPTTVSVETGPPSRDDLRRAPVRAVASFTEPTEGCSDAYAFSDEITFFIKGSALEITRSDTGEKATGTIRADGSFSTRFPGSDDGYQGRLEGADGAGTYRHTSGDCATTWKLAFHLHH